jgi:hypothetical protein
MDENRKADLRKEIDDADDTGLVAGEELITQAETLLPLLRREAAPPREKLHAALPREHRAHGTIDALHEEIEGTAPSRQAIERHVHDLRSLPELEAIVAQWWESPRTQRFVEILGQIGV